jgi:hypothetical protein
VQVDLHAMTSKKLSEEVKPYDPAK